MEVWTRNGVEITDIREIGKEANEQNLRVHHYMKGEMMT